MYATIVRQQHHCFEATAILSGYNHQHSGGTSTCKSTPKFCGGSTTKLASTRILCGSIASVVVLKGLGSGGGSVISEQLGPVATPHGRGGESGGCGRHEEYMRTNLGEFRLWMMLERLTAGE